MRVVGVVDWRESVRFVEISGLWKMGYANLVIKANVQVVLIPGIIVLTPVKKNAQNVTQIKIAQNVNQDTISNQANVHVKLTILTKLILSF